MTGRHHLRVYTDGACSGNPGPGGWAWASSPDHHDSGGEADTTNNRMELTAVLRALESNVGPLTVVMDSTYVKDGLEKWTAGWVRNGWRTRSGDPVKNRDLWQPLVAARDARPAGELDFEWVPGHSGDVMNDLVDGLAVVQRDAHRSGSPVAGSPGGGGRIADLPAQDQRAERRRRDPRIPEGYLLVVVGHGPDGLGGWAANPISERVRSDLAETVGGLARIHPDLVVVTGLRPGAEVLAAEACIKADVDYCAVVAFPGMEKNLSADARARFVDLVGRARSVVAFEKKVPADTDAFRKAMARRDAWLGAAADEAILVWDERDNRYDRLHSDLDRRLGSGLTVLHPPSG